MIVFVEFFGLPGAGKSTLSEVLAERLTERFGQEFQSTSSVLWDDRSKWSRRLHKIRLLLVNSLGAEHRPLIKKALRVRQSTQMNRMHALAPLATFFAIRSQFKSRNQSAVFDQGLLQSAFSLIYSAVNDAEAKAVVDSLVDFSVESDQLHIIVETPPDVCHARLEQRVNNHSRLEPGEDDNWQKSVQNFAHIKERLYRGYAEKGLAPRVITVAGTDPVDVSLARILEWVESFSTEAAK